MISSQSKCLEHQGAYQWAPRKKKPKIQWEQDTLNNDIDNALAGGHYQAGNTQPNQPLVQKDLISGLVISWPRHPKQAISGTEDTKNHDTEPRTEEDIKMPNNDDENHDDFHHHKWNFSQARHQNKRWESQRIKHEQIEGPAGNRNQAGGNNLMANTQPDSQIATQKDLISGEISDT